MWRFLIVTFAFLGWGFYELSGGADYEPRAGSLQAEAYRVFSALHVQQGDIATAPSDPDAQARLVSRAAVDLTSLPIVTTANPVLGAPAGIAPAVERVDIAEPPASPVVKASLSENGNIKTRSGDIRTISASVVNMRMGPGTRYDVVTKLRLGETVEVLSDPGEGWLKLRVLETGRIGWMSDALVTAAVD